MKEIAEYFREMSKGDAKFESEGDVSPDGLRDFIERRSRQSVEAHRNGNEIRVRASQPAPGSMGAPRNVSMDRELTERLTRLREKSVAQLGEPENAVSEEAPFDADEDAADLSSDNAPAGDDPSIEDDGVQETVTDENKEPEDATDSDLPLRVETLIGKMTGKVPPEKLGPGQARMPIAPGAVESPAEPEAAKAPEPKTAEAQAPTDSAPASGEDQEPTTEAKPKPQAMIPRQLLRTKRIPPAPESLLKDEEELARRANARLLALRRELDPLIGATPPEESDIVTRRASAASEPDTPQAETPQPQTTAQQEPEKSGMPAPSSGHGSPETQDKPAQDERKARIPSKDTPVSRLLREADDMLEGAENKRRHISIAHLKKAVAATKAEHRSISRERSRQREERDQDPYRRDLAKAVGKPRSEEPRQTQSPPSQDARQTQSPPAQEAAAPKNRVPLMLVSDQRVAEDDIKETQQPQKAPASAKDSFADYAQRHGAHALPELLEAAVAYGLMGSDGNDVTRPEIMRTLAEHYGEDEFSREESLRVFGMLLREGRIEKLKGGRFSLPSGSPFLDQIPGE